MIWSSFTSGGIQMQAKVDKYQEKWRRLSINKKNLPEI
jgi:hypothetical protein